MAKNALSSNTTATPVAGSSRKDGERSVNHRRPVSLPVSLSMRTRLNLVGFASESAASVKMYEKRSAFTVALYRAVSTGFPVGA